MHAPGPEGRGAVDAPRTPRGCCSPRSATPTRSSSSSTSTSTGASRARCPRVLRDAAARAASAREGDDLAVIAYGAMVHVALEAAEEIDGASVEVLDLRSLVPLDEEAILDVGAQDCSKVVIVDEANLTCAAGAQVASLIAERGFEDLDGPVGASRRPTCRSRSPAARGRGAARASTA